MIGLCAVPLPPVVASWTQDFQWSMGIINIGFVQSILTWYQRSTGGTPSVIFSNLHAVSVQVEKRKRSLEALPMVESGLKLMKRAVSTVSDTQLGRRAMDALTRRGNIQTSYGTYIVKGIQRVAFRARIESTNLFMTGLTFFYVFAVIASILVLLFKLGVEVATRYRWINSETFSDFRHGWLSVLKGMKPTSSPFSLNSYPFTNPPQASSSD